MLRSRREVAVQSLIYGTLGFRASLEVTVHPRSATLSAQLLPWLERLNLGDRIAELHREILETPYRELSRESQAEAYWRGEAAAFLGWAIQLFDRPNPVQSVDAGVLVERLKLLQPAASDLISNANLRTERELEDYCAFCLSVRHYCQLSALDDDGQNNLRGIHHMRLAELGLNEALVRQQDLELDAARLASGVPRVRGLYVVRALSAEWLLGQDS